MHRTLDPAFLNGVANDPDVRPFIGPGDEPVDLSTCISDPANITLIAHHGGWVLQKQEAGIYELHTMFLPKGRGRAYFQAAREALRYVFSATDAIEIVTKVPLSNRGADLAAKVAGFEERFARDDAVFGPTSYRALTLDRWVSMDDEVVTRGGWFHEALHAAKAEAGSPLPDHPEDEAHNRAVGATVLMLAAGNARKGVWAYNRWARLAGYQTLELLSEVPIVVDVRDAIVGVTDGEMEILLCRR